MTIPDGAVEAVMEILAARDYPSYMPDPAWARAALEAAAPHMQRTASTAGDLAELPVGAVVLSDEIAYQKCGDETWCGDGRDWHDSQISPPATILHKPTK